jgi:hypothetical protein
MSYCYSCQGNWTRRNETFAGVTLLSLLLSLGAKWAKNTSRKTFVYFTKRREISLYPSKRFTADHKPDIVRWNIYIWFSYDRCSKLNFCFCLISCLTLNCLDYKNSFFGLSAYQSSQEIIHVRSSVVYGVEQLVMALRYKPEGRGFDPRCCLWNFSLT